MSLRELGLLAAEAVWLDEWLQELPPSKYPVGYTECCRQHAIAKAIYGFYPPTCLPWDGYGYQLVNHDLASNRFWLESGLLVTWATCDSIARKFTGWYV